MERNKFPKIDRRMSWMRSRIWPIKLKLMTMMTEERKRREQQPISFVYINWIRLDLNEMNTSIECRKKTLFTLSCFYLSFNVKRHWKMVPEKDEKPAHFKMRSYSDNHFDRFAANGNDKMFSKHAHRSSLRGN